MAVLTGAQAWHAKGFAELRGMTVGLVANHTARVDDNLTTLEALRATPDVRVSMLFGPEHGAFGNFDDEVPNSVDPASGLPIRSLYGESRKPSDNDLAGLDALVFEIQDIGARFYTYASTLGLCLEGCANRGLPLIVLDRPNPITGSRCEGPTADPDRLSFTAHHTIPIRHGLTLGELARLYAIDNGWERWVKVAECVGLTRGAWFDQTGVAWIRPSPAMPTLNAAILYPGVCLLEKTNMSVGRGTEAPFETVGAPYIDSRRWIEALNRLAIPGVAFEPAAFTPTLREFAGNRCHGIRLIVTDRESLDSVRLGIALLVSLRDLYPVVYDLSGALDLLANARAYESLAAGGTVDDVCATWTESLKDWHLRRQPALLY